MPLKTTNNDVGFIYDEYAPALYGVIRSIIDDKTKADNLLIRIFNDLSEELKNYEHRDGLFLWLVNLSRNRAISQLVEDNDQTKAAQVNTYVGNLPPLQKTIFSLVYFKGLKIDEVADILQLPVARIEPFFKGLPDFTPYLFPNIKRPASPVPDMLQSLCNVIIPADDSARVAALKKYEILYTPAEEEFDKITQMAARIFDTPMSFLSLVDEETVFYKSQVGSFGRMQVNREHSLCSLTILSREPLVIEDASLSDCFKDNPFVSAENGIRFYAGAPLITKDGYLIGALCVVDTKQKTFSTKDTLLLTEFAELAMREIEIRHDNFQQMLFEEQLARATRVESMSS